MCVKTNLRPRNYKVNEVYRIVNPEQAKRFIKHRCFPIDLYSSINKNKEDIIVYVFLRKECEELKRQWDNFELE